MNHFQKIITVDGAASTGKTTIASKISQKIGYCLFDSGYLYRSFCWYLIQKKIEIKPRDVYVALQEFHPEIHDDGSIYVQGENMTTYLQDPEVTQLVSYVGSGFFVRKYMREIQRQFCAEKNGKVVVTGRDVGRDVFPESKFKFFLQATSEARALRRHTQLKELGIDSSYENILEQINQRDLRDSTRKVSPMGSSEDAHLIDTSELSVDEVVAIMYEIITDTQVSIEGQQRRNPEH